MIRSKPQIEIRQETRRRGGFVCRSLNSREFRARNKSILLFIGNLQYTADYTPIAPIDSKRTLF